MQDSGKKKKEKKKEKKDFALHLPPNRHHRRKAALAAAAKAAAATAAQTTELPNAVESFLGNGMCRRSPAEPALNSPGPRVKKHIPKLNVPNAPALHREGKVAP